MQIVFGPRMTEAEKILAKHLLRGSGLDGKWKESALRIRKTWTKIAGQGAKGERVRPEENHAYLSC